MGIQAACVDMEKRLAEVLSRFQECCDNMYAVERAHDTFLTDILRHKLALLIVYIELQANRLYREHGGEGHVIVLFSKEEGFSTYWVKNREEISAERMMEQYGIEVTSVRDAQLSIMGILHKLCRGDWFTALQWLKKNGKSPGLNFGDYPLIRMKAHDEEEQ